MNARLAGMLRHRLEELGIALGLLTRFPLPTFPSSGEASVSSSFWAYPLAGALVGLASAIVYGLAFSAGFGTTSCVLLTMAAGLLAAGGFHEDGLSDFWDGLGGGQSREAKLIIMRDSRIGSYGVMALVMKLALQASLLVSLQHYAGVTTVAAALIAAEAAARGALIVPLVCLTPARRDGLGAAMKELRPAQVAAAGAIAAAIAIVCLQGLALMLLAGALLGGGVITALAWRFLAGFTGDVLGAAVTTARIAALGALILEVAP
jgi:adenosylcobinamide-GDP ribazoletransferase